MLILDSRLIFTQSFDRHSSLLRRQQFCGHGRVREHDEHDHPPQAAQSSSKISAVNALETSLLKVFGLTLSRIRISKMAESL